jgi:polyisoprenoid-binding protein YceI
MNRTIFLASAITLIAGIAPAFAADNEWAIDSMHSAAHFKIRHMMVSNVEGTIGGIKGAVTYDGKNLKLAKVDTTLDLNTINTNEPKRDEDLKSENFFDAGKYPTISFKSEKIVPQADGSFKLMGQLTMHGVSKEVTLNTDAIPAAVKDPYGNTRTGTSATTKINRKDFGLTYNKMLDNGGALVGDDVQITIDMEMVKKK